MFNPNVVVKNIVTQPGADSFISLVARLLIAYIFLAAGWGKITGYSQIIIKPIQWCNELFRTF
ncbi:hypothetical protein GCM10010203_43820 [Actinomadura yumaensis]